MIIKNRKNGLVIYSDDKITIKETLESAIKNGAYLSGAKMYGYKLVKI